MSVQALRWPKSSFEFVGIDASGSGGGYAMEQEVAAEARRTAEGERVHSLLPFREDPYGCAVGGALSAKGAERDPHRRGVPYPMGCGELCDLFRHCEPSLFEGALPWWSGGESDDDDGGASLAAPRPPEAPGQATIK